MRLLTNTRRRARIFGGTVGLLVLGAASPSAHAQSIDYSALERLFGEPVTTSATGSPQRISDVPMTMEIISAEQIRKTGAYDIPGVLREVIGVDVLQWTNGNADVSVRGYNQAGSARLLVLVDGRQVYADYFGFTPWSALPVQMAAIRQIEIVKGPNCALFGFNAVGGVINIITSNPLYDDVNTVSVAGGTQGFAEASAVGTFKYDDRAALRIDLGGRTGHDFSTPAPDFLAIERRGDHHGSASFTGLLQIADGIQVGMEGTHSEASDDEISPITTPAYLHYLTNSMKALLLAETPAGLIRASAYSNWIKAEYLFGSDVSSGQNSPLFHNNTIVVQIEDVAKPNPNSTVRGSVEYRRNAEGTTPVGGGNVKYDVASVGGMWEWKFVSNAWLTNALRIDLLSLGRDGTSPPGYPFDNRNWDRTLARDSFNSSLVWRTSNIDTLRLAVSRGAQLPNLVDFGAVVAITPAGNFTGVPTLDPTIVTNYEVDWDRVLVLPNARFRVGIYHQTSSGISSVYRNLLFANEQVYATAGNIGDSRADGVELSLKGEYAQAWHWSLGYTAEIIRDQFNSPPIPNFFRTDFEHTTPVHVLTAALGWARGRWEINGSARYESTSHGFAPTSLYDIPTLVPIPAYVSINGRIGYAISNRLTLSASGQNLAPSRQHQTSNADVARRIVATLSLQL